VTCLVCPGGTFTKTGSGATDPEHCKGKLSFFLEGSIEYFFLLHNHLLIKNLCENTSALINKNTFLLCARNIDFFQL
jgi:hypothetical protein